VNFWLAKKMIFNKKFFKEPTTIFSIGGIALSVALLMVVMAGFTGFSMAFKKSVVDLFGDVAIYKRGGAVIKDPSTFEKEIRKKFPEIKDALPYANVRALVASKGKITTSILTGLPLSGSRKALGFESRVISKADPSKKLSGYGAYLGKEVAAKLGLKAGDNFTMIVLRAKRSSMAGVESSMESFHVASILDFGKYDFNSKYLITDLIVVQELGRLRDKVSGFRLTLNDSEDAQAFGQRLSEDLGFDYGVLDWVQASGNIVRAVEYEKRVLFFLMYIILVAAFLNVCSTLYLNVMKRYSQISILKTLGVSNPIIVGLFLMKGLIVALIGLCLGVGLGTFFSFLYETVQRLYPIMPSKVYHVTFITSVFQWQDLLWAFVATIVTSVLATLAPAITGARIQPVEGLKYE